MSKKKHGNAVNSATQPATVKNFFFGIPEIVITGLSLALLTAFIGIITGIHYDETWVILRCRDIAGGLRPLDGMTHYAGAIHQYILWPFFSLFGYHIEVLRVISALFNTGAMLLAMLLVRQYYPGTNWHRYAGLILCTTPAFIVFTRYAGEVQCLNLFLTMGSLLLLAKAVTTPDRKKRMVRAIGAGISLGVIAYNHIISIAVPISLLAAAIMINGREAITSRISRHAGIGFAIGFSVRIYEILFDNFVAKSMHKASESSFGAFLADLPNLPIIFNNLINGSLLYQRFVGDTVLFVFPYITLSVILLVIGRFVYLKRHRFSSEERFMLLFTGFLIFFTILISPNFTPHYFILPMYLLSIIIVLLVKPYTELSVTWMKNSATGILITIISLNLVYAGINYFYGFLKTGGTPSVFMVGNRLIETSNSWVRFDRLYKQLSDRGIRMVIADLSIYAPMQIHDFYNKRLMFSGYHRIPSHEQQLDGKTALIFYRGINLVNKRQIKPPEQDRVNFGTITYVHDPSFDRNFKVFLADPAIK